MSFFRSYARIFSALDFASDVLGWQYDCSTDGSTIYLSLSDEEIVAHDLFDWPRVTEHNAARFYTAGIFKKLPAGHPGTLTYLRSVAPEDRLVGYLMFCLDQASDAVILEKLLYDSRDAIVTAIQSERNLKRRKELIARMHADRLFGRLVELYSK